MLPRLKEARVLPGHHVWLRFADGVAGEIDLSGELWGEVFEPLQEEGFFARMSLDPELGTIVWPNGADFAPEFLYERLQSNRSSESHSAGDAA